MIDKKARLKMSPQIKDSSFYAYIGSRRAGKSISAIAQAFRICPDLDIENVVFSWEDLKYALTHKTRTAIVWDETAVSAYNRDWMTQANKQINKAMQVFGYRQLCIICTFQHISQIDVQLRQQLDALFWNYGFDFYEKEKGAFTRKSLKPYAVKKNPFRVPTVVPYEIERPSDLHSLEIGWVDLPELDELCRICGIKQSWLKDYEKKKEEFFQDLNSDEDNTNEKINMKQFKMWEKQNLAFRNSVKYMEEKLHYSQNEVAKILGIPRTTLAGWRKNFEEST